MIPDSGIMVWLVRSLTVDKWLVSNEYLRKIPTCTWMLLELVHSIVKKKHHNLTGLITLMTCYWHMCYRIIIASKQTGGIKTKKVYRLPCLGLPIFFSIPPQLGAFSQANKLLDKCGQLLNRTFFVKKVFSSVYEIKSIYFQSNKVYRWLCCGIVVGFFSWVSNVVVMKKKVKKWKW